MHDFISLMLLIQCNLSIPNLVYSEIVFNPKKIVWSEGILPFLTYKITLCIPNPVHSEFRT